MVGKQDSPTHPPTHPPIHRDEHLNEEHVLELARYMHRELSSLLLLPKEAVFESRFKWGPLPGWEEGGRKGGGGGGRKGKRAPRFVTSAGKPVVEEEEEEENEVVEAKGEEEEEEDKRGEWRTAFSEQGRMYYWNVRTRESTYDKPY